MDKHDIMTLTRVCQAFRSSLKKSALFYSWRHVCFKCNNETGYIINGRRLCRSHVFPWVQHFGHHFQSFRSPCVCFNTSIVNDNLCAHCGQEFCIEGNMTPFDNCHCYVRQNGLIHRFIRYYDIVRIVLQDRIIYVHSYCNNRNGPCPFSYNITHNGDCCEVPKPLIKFNDRHSEKIEKYIH
jgi:hypothetical protein